MKRFLLLIFIAIATFLLFAFFKNPELLNDIWLWLIGLAGLIIKTGKGMVDYFKSLFEKPDQMDQNNAVSASNNNQNEDKTEGKPVRLDPSKTQITLLRFQDDGQTSLGLLYINNKFYCYTLEDTFRKVKIPGETRIPSGTYNVDFRREETDLTRTYRQRFPDWFNYHLHIQDVPNFQSIYIHSGGDHTHTEGCILVSDSMNAGKESTFLSNSKNTYKNLYTFLEKHILEGKKIIMTIKDEAWIRNLPV
jgi:hypothetical protein